MGASSLNPSAAFNSRLNSLPSGPLKRFRDAYRWAAEEMWEARCLPPEPGLDRPRRLAATPMHSEPNTTRNALIERRAPNPSGLRPMIGLFDPEGNRAFHQHAEEGIAAAERYSLQQRFTVFFDQSSQKAVHE